MFDYTKDHGQKSRTFSTLTPHPDGTAWPKCCRAETNGDGISCAFIKNQDSGARLTIHETSDQIVYGSDGQRFAPEKVPFMCAHRSTDDGYHRVCAGWDACFGNKSQRIADAK